MNTRIAISACVVAAVSVFHSATVSAQCPEPPENARIQMETSWRQRLAPWIPQVTLEVANRLEHERSGKTRADKIEWQIAKESGSRSLSRATLLDWQVAAHWDVVELVESLSPAPDMAITSDRETACDASAASRASANQEEL